MRKKFANCDVVAVLQEIVGWHVKHYKTDFDIDKEIFAEAVKSKDPERKYLFWLARPCGTVCLFERDIYVADTYSHNSWRFYNEQVSDPIIAYAVELKGIRKGIIKGDLYELDYPASCEHVKKNAANKSFIVANYKDGTSATVPYNNNWREIFDDDKLKDGHFIPADIDAWATTLAKARAERHSEHYAVGKINQSEM